MAHRTHSRNQAGFTLLELLVVLGIMAAVAGVGVMALGTVGQQSKEQLLRAEMDNIANAMRRFRADTGYWPKEGAFAADNSPNWSHPANLEQLRRQPVSAAGDILPYDVASGTGWNGPYLRELDAAQVRIGSGLAADGNGDPTAGGRIDIYGYGDPFGTGPIDMVPTSSDEDMEDFVNYWFIWEDEDSDGDLDRAQVGRLGWPFLYFFTSDPTDADSNGFPDYDNDNDGELDNVNGCRMPCLVSMGPDGIYATVDDHVVNIAGN